MSTCPGTNSRFLSCADCYVDDGKGDRIRHSLLHVLRSLAALRRHSTCPLGRYQTIHHTVSMSSPRARVNCSYARDFSCRVSACARRQARKSIRPRVKPAQDLRRCVAALLLVAIFFQLPQIAAPPPSADPTPFPRPFSTIIGSSTISHTAWCARHKYVSTSAGQACTIS